uniref:CBS domain-containing protein n=1 Tax=Bicosoecida sp. CB-2014 TaxID=1486930 RepID=A0A7S1CIJ7_9STRA|mmetsp:Transcript_28046/g.97011  ORF Transcript_28046/g.97011 Transcript_28046/m.97011 type:complete len:452 (+) Transcript_28046:199-1554(+)
MAAALARIAVEEKETLSGRTGSMTELGDWAFVGHLAETFGAISVNALTAPAEIVTVNSDMTLVEAVDRLSKAKILCAPVIDVECTVEAPTWRQKYCGLFDLSDVVVFVTKATKKKGAAAGLADFRHAMAHKALFATTRVKDVAHRLSKDAPFLCLDAEVASLLDVIHFLGKHHYHRVFVSRGESSDLVNIITQSHVVDLLGQHAKKTREMTEVADKTLEELGMVKAPGTLIKAKVTDEAFSAFEKMKEHKVSAVPVVDEEGHIVGNISNRDIRVLVHSSSVYKQIHSPLHHFLAEVKGSVVDADEAGAGSDGEDRGAKPSVLAESDTDDRASAVTVHPTDTLRVVLRVLHATRIHRVYVADEAGKPVSVVTLTDILRVMAPESSVEAGVALSRRWSDGSRGDAIGLSPGSHGDVGSPGVALGGAGAGAGGAAGGGGGGDGDAGAEASALEI